MESDQFGALDRKRGLMVETARAGAERLLQRRFELDLAQAAMTVSGIPELRADQRFAWSEAIFSERVFAVVVPARLLERAVAKLRPDAAYLVAVPANADKSRNRFVRGEQNLGAPRGLVAD